MNPVTALARSYGLQMAYYDVSHRRRTATQESVLAVLRALGAVNGEKDASDALRERRLAYWRRVADPVVVAWDGRLDSIDVRLPEAAAVTIDCSIEVDGLEVFRMSARADEAPAARREEVEGEPFVIRRLRLRRRLPIGYHTLRIEFGRSRAEALLISAPLHAYEAPTDDSRRVWGAFAPLYALRSLDNWGAGDFSDLSRLSAWVEERGGSALMTLPLLASFLDWPFNPSPYSPVSRLFWNEMYIDMSRVPEMAWNPEAREMAASPDLQESVHRLRRSDYVDYRGVMAAKRKVLEQLAMQLFESHSERRNDFEEWVEEHPNVRDYAHFRATIERTSALWPDWPARMREGEISGDDYDSAAARYHLYVQWLTESQIGAATEEAGDRGVSLFFDMPLGVDRCGYDVWRFRDSFVNGVSGGAPPDAFFTKGQDWGFPPLSPEGERESGYRYFRASIGHLLRIAGLLRIDHIMGLHRLYWVPVGMPASQGVYVKYPAEELYAVLCLESHRHQAAIMGEDLGTVPHFVRRAMSRHNILRSYVLQFELPGRGPLRKPPKKSVATLNTHDMPPFASFWRGIDIDERLELGHIDSATAKRQRKERAASRKQLTDELRRSGKLDGGRPSDTAPVTASIGFLMNSPASAVIINMEDLWQETEPQNIPGTTERPNWRHKMRRSLEELPAIRDVNDLLADVGAEQSDRAEVLR